MKTIYISVPMSRRSEEEVIADIGFAKHELERRRYPMRIITPLDLKESMDNLYAKKLLKDPEYFDYLVSDITILLKKCDAVCFCRGWQQSRGCRLEMAAAKIFEKAIIYCN